MCRLWGGSGSLSHMLARAKITRKRDPFGHFPTSTFSTLVVGALVDVGVVQMPSRCQVQHSSRTLVLAPWL